MDQPTELQTRPGADVDTAPVDGAAAPQDLAALRSRLAGLSPDKRRLVERMLARKGTDLGIIRRAGGAPEAPCSFEQERLWFMYELLTRREIFHVPVALRIDGDLDAPALERALQQLTRRHEALRTVFRQRDGKPFQLVLDRMTIPLDQVDCRRETDPTAAARRLASELVTEDFDLTEGPLVRCTLFRVGERTHLLALVQHHIVSDNWSLGILLDDLGRLYANELGVPVELAPLDVHYPDFAEWQRSTVDGASTRRTLEHWRERLDGAPDALDLPTDRPRPAIRGSQGQFHHVRFGADLVAGLRDLARRHDTTLLGAFLAGYVALLSRLVRTESLVVGVPVAGRPQAETQRMIGYFLNWLPIHVRVGDRPDLHTLVRRTGSALADAMGHQDIPFDMLVRELQPSRRPGVTPIFQTSFSLRDGAPTPPRMPGLEITSSSSRAARPTTTDGRAVVRGRRGGRLPALRRRAPRCRDGRPLGRLAGDAAARRPGHPGRPGRRPADAGRGRGRRHPRPCPDRRRPATGRRCPPRSPRRPPGGPTPSPSPTTSRSSPTRSCPSGPVGSPPPCGSGAKDPAASSVSSSTAAWTCPPRSSACSRPVPPTCRWTRRTRPTAPPTSSPSARCGPC